MTSSSASRSSASPKRHRQLLDVLALLHRLIDVAALGLARVELAGQPVVERHQQGGGQEVGVHHAVDGAVLEPAGRRDAQAAGAVLVAPVGVDRRPEALVPQPAVGVDGRAADARSAPADARSRRRRSAGRPGPASSGAWPLSGMKWLSPPHDVGERALEPGQVLVAEHERPCPRRRVQSEMLVWQPLAETPMNGLDMKQAIRPNSRATCEQIWR